MTHPELKATFCLDILGGQEESLFCAMYTSLGVITKGTVIEVSVRAGPGYDDWTRS